MIRTLVTFATLLLLWVLVGQVNHYLATQQITLFVGGLFVTFAALRLPTRIGLMSVMLAGLLNDASTPAAFGTQMMLFATAFLILHRVRDRLPHEETFVQVVIAFFANLGLFLAFALVQGGKSLGPNAARLGFDLLCSQAFIGLAGPWFLALQTRALQLTRLGISAFD